MKARNRLMAILLAFMMVLTYMPTMAFAQEVPDAEQPAEIEEQVNGNEELDSEVLEKPEEGTEEGKQKGKDFSAEEEVNLLANPENVENQENLEDVQDGEGDEETVNEERPKIVDFQLDLSSSRTGDDEQIWGYVGDWFPQNFPMDGDRITITYDNGDVDKYVCGEITEGVLEGAVNIHLVDKSGKTVYETQDDGELFPVLLSDSDAGVGKDMMTPLSEDENNDYYIEFGDRYDNDYLYKTTAIGRVEQGVTFTYVHDGEITVYEGVDGWMDSEGEDDSTINFFHYSWDSLPDFGDTATISRDGTTRTYTFNKYTLNFR